MNNETIYQERRERIKKTISLEPVDRLPVVYNGGAFSPRYMGMSMAEFCRDPEAAVRVTLEAMDRLNAFGSLDGANLPILGRSTPQLSYVWLSRVAVPGRDLPDDDLWQVIEAEVMTPADYDTIIRDGWMNFVAGFMPKIIDPDEFQEFFNWLMMNGNRIMNLYREHGYVVVSDAILNPVIPFESLCGGRSMTKFFFDLYRIPDKVEEVMKVMMKDIMAQIQTYTATPDNIGTWVGGWRSSSNLIAPKLWDRFVWPYYLTVIEALVEKGITPILHWDQDWTRDLVRLQELPARKCVLNPDGMTDLSVFKKLVGDRMAVMGDVPSSLLAAGTPDDVDRYVKERVDLFEGKGLILCPGCDAPINARPENMERFVAASYKYGSIL